MQMQNSRIIKPKPIKGEKMGVYPMSKADSEDIRLDLKKSSESSRSDASDNDKQCSDFNNRLAN